MTFDDPNWLQREIAATKREMSELPPAAVVAIVRESLLSAHTEIGDWLQLASALREWFDQNSPNGTNERLCPTAEGIEVGLRIQAEIGQALRMLREKTKDDLAKSEVQQVVAELREQNARLAGIVECVIKNAALVNDATPNDVRGPAWARVMHVTGVGSTRAHELCREFGVDPDFDCAKGK